MEESHNSYETESDDDTVTQQHKTPLKVDVNKNFKTKRMQQQDNEAQILKQQKDKTPDTYTDNGETFDNNIDTYTPETDDKKLREIHIWSNNKHFIGTEDQAILAKWHDRSGHICDQYILLTAHNTIGMEEVVKLPTNTHTHTQL